MKYLVILLCFLFSLPSMAWTRYLGTIEAPATASSPNTRNNLNTTIPFKIPPRVAIDIFCNAPVWVEFGADINVAVTSNNAYPIGSYSRQYTDVGRNVIAAQSQTTATICRIFEVVNPLGFKGGDSGGATGGRTLLSTNEKLCFDGAPCTKSLYYDSLSGYIQSTAGIFSQSYLQVQVDLTVHQRFGIKPVGSLQSCGTGYEGAFQVQTGGGGKYTKLCFCGVNASGMHGWMNIAKLTAGTLADAFGTSTTCPDT